MHWITAFLGIALGALLCCEFIADYVKLGQCAWPKLHQVEDESNNLKVMLLADTHLLGPFRGHWLDKLYREWHMHRAFQAAMTLHQPELVFVLGDLFDEGDFVDHVQFREYTMRFQRLFHVPHGTPIISVVGNHDIGFHYKMWRQPSLVQRFKHKFNNTGVNLYTYKNVHFVLINSMAMENDDCHFCKNALNELNDIASKLNCLQNKDNCDIQSTWGQHQIYSRPIVLQHFPTFRISDNACKEHDAPLIELYRENWEVLSKSSTDLLGELLQPRLAFAGHSHHYCLSVNRWGVEEYTIASFSWRNKVNPSFLLATFSPTDYAVTKCNMLPQRAVYSIYFATAILLFMLLLWQLCKKLFKHKYVKIRTKSA